MFQTGERDPDQFTSVRATIEVSRWRYYGRRAFVLVPIDGSEVSVRSSTGGHLVVDVVGTFEAVGGPVAAGRFVPVDSYRAADLETATEGRELDISFDRPELATGLGSDLAQAGAVLAVVTADVGQDGGIVQLGPDRDSFDQMLMWAPALDGNRQRRGLVLLEPTGEALGSLRYNGGTRLSVDVVGDFTSDEAPVPGSGDAFDGQRQLPQGRTGGHAGCRRSTGREFQLLSIRARSRPAQTKPGTNRPRGCRRRGRGFPRSTPG